MKKEFTTEQAKVAKAIRIMLKIAQRILEDKKTKASEDDDESKAEDKPHFN